MPESSLKPKLASNRAECMRIVMILTAAPEHPMAWHAVHLAESLSQMGHQVLPFFYMDAVRVANSLQRQPSDQPCLLRQWQQLPLDKPVCVSAALARGVTDADNQQQHQLPTHNLANGFRLTGLGELAELTLTADRLIRL